MKRIILVVLRCIFKLPYWWFYKLKQYQNKEKYPTIDEGYQFIHNVADEIVKKARVDLECYGLENLPQDGVVFKFDDVEYGKTLGNTSHHFRNGIAYKILNY